MKKNKTWKRDPWPTKEFDEMEGKLPQWLFDEWNKKRPLPKDIWIWETRAFRGWIRVVFALFIIYADTMFGDAYHHKIINNWTYNFFLNTLGFEFVKIDWVKELTSISFGIFTFYQLIKGVYLIYTRNATTGIQVVWGGDEMYGSKPIENDYSNINRIMGYRESALYWKTSGDAASEIARTSWVDGLMANRDNMGDNTKRALGSLDAKLYWMDNAKGYEYLKNLSKS